MNDINELRTHMFETLRGLRDKDNPLDIDRAKAVSDIAKTIIDSVRVEVDFLRATGENRGTGFIVLLDASADNPPQSTRNSIQMLRNDKNGKTTVEQRDGMTITRNVSR